MCMVWMYGRCYVWYVGAVSSIDRSALRTARIYTYIQIENAYYAAKGDKESDPEAALQGFLQVWYGWLGVGMWGWGVCMYMHDRPAVPLLHPINTNIHTTGGGPGGGARAAGGMGLQGAKAVRQAALRAGAARGGCQGGYIYMCVCVLIYVYNEHTPQHTPKQPRRHQPTQPTKSQPPPQKQHRRC